MKSKLEIIPVSHIDEVLKLALIKPIEAIEWTEQDEADLAGVLANPDSATGRVVAH